MSTEEEEVQTIYKPVSFGDKEASDILFEIAQATALHDRSTAALFEALGTYVYQLETLVIEEPDEIEEAVEEQGVESRERESDKDVSGLPKKVVVQQDTGT
tara:strand:- start:147 stop:449 length:303 start_codon:yes stop_codon:yes gene_type:complete